MFSVTFLNSSLDSLRFFSLDNCQLSVLKSLVLFGTFLAYLFNPLMPGGNKKGHTYLNKPATERSAFSCRSV